MKRTAAIVGPGNIGTDLMYKLLRSDVIEPRWMIGVDPTSEGLKLAADQGLESTHEGVDWLLKQDELPDLIFEATSAYVHREYAPRYEEAGIRAVDLTPAAVGPAVIPPVNGQEHVGRDERQHDHLRRPGHDPDGGRGVAGRAPFGGCRTPRSSPRSRRSPPAPAPAPTSTSSPGPRPSGVETIGGAERGKAIIILNPAEPPMIMRDTIFCAVSPDADRDAIVAVDRGDGEGGPGVRAGLPAAAGAADRRAVAGHPGPGEGVDLRRGGGRRRLPAAVLREPRHHDRRRHAGRREHCEERCASTADTRTDARRARTWSGTHGDEPWGELDLRLTDTCLRDGSHHKRHQFTAQECHDIVEALDASGVPVIEVTHGDGLGGSSFNYGFSKTRGAGAHQDRGRDRQAGQDRLPDAPGRRHQGRHPRRAGQRRPDLPDRHALHRGGRLDPALRAGPRARPGDGRLPDDVAHPAARGAGQAGPDHGRRRLPVRLRRRLGRRADHGADRATASPRWSPRSATSPTSASTATRTSASASPTRSSPPARAPPRSTARSAASAPAPATPRSRRSSASATSSAGPPASTSCRSSTPPRTSSSRPCPRSASSTG